MVLSKRRTNEFGYLSLGSLLRGFQWQKIEVVLCNILYPFSKFTIKNENNSSFWQYVSPPSHKYRLILRKVLQWLNFCNSETWSVISAITACFPSAKHKFGWLRGECFVAASGFGDWEASFGFFSKRLTERGCFPPGFGNLGKQIFHAVISGPLHRN